MAETRRSLFLGGTCVNVGCLPSKILLRAAHLAHLQEAHPFDGLGRARARVNRRALVRQQQRRVEELRRAKYADILEANPRLALLRGSASFEDEHTLRVELADGGLETLRPTSTPGAS